MGRSPEELNQGALTGQENMILSKHIRLNGDRKWRNLPNKAGLRQCGNSCKLHWLNFLRPDIKQGNISPEEEELIIRMHRLLGNRWSLIAGRLPGRTANEIKNYWNTHLKKKLLSINESQSKTMSKSPSPLRNDVIKSTPVRITTEMPWCNLPVKDSINPEPVQASNLGDVNLIETEVRNFTLADQKSPHCDHFAGIVAESLADLNGISPPDNNLLRSPSFSWTDFAVEQYSTEVDQSNSNMQHFNSYTFSYDEGRVGIYETIDHVDWIRDLDYIWN